MISTQIVLINCFILFFVEVIEHFQSVTRTEAKKSGSAAKIECVVST